MITVITTTNRPNNNTLVFGKAYQQLLNELNIDNQLLSMEDIPTDMLFADMFTSNNSNFIDLQEKYIKNATKFVVVSPEYNGSFPGVFKGFIDITPPPMFNHKKVMLTGVASGRAGNLRGMDHLTDVFHHLKAEVFHNKLPISGIDGLIENGKIKDTATLDSMKQQLEGFLNF